MAQVGSPFPTLEMTRHTGWKVRPQGVDAPKWTIRLHEEVTADEGGGRAAEGKTKQNCKHCIDSELNAAGDQDEKPQPSRSRYIVNDSVD